MKSNMPSGDVWRLSDSDRDSQNYGKVYKFDFSYIQDEKTRRILKEFVWANYRTGNRVLRSLREHLLQFKYFNAFSEIERVDSLKNISNATVERFRTYLRLYISFVTGRPLSYSYQKSCFDTLKAVINWCRIYMLENAPEKEIFTGNEYRGVHRQLKINFIPDKVLEQINQALKNEDNPYIRYGTIILEATGMRIGDLLLLETDCIREHPVSGNAISWFDHKNRKNRDMLPVPAECAEAVRQLVKVTEGLRHKADEDIQNRLFLYKPKFGTNKREIIVVSRLVLNQWYHRFAQEHGIIDSDGQIYNITTRKFRRTLATDMLSKGANIKVIQEVLGHASVTTTKLYYADVKDTSMAEIFSHIGIIGNIQEVNEKDIPDVAEREWFELNRNGRARLCDGYCTRPVNNGEICSRLVGRQKCYTCARYITTLADLVTHKNHLKELQELIDTNIYGEHYAAHFLPTMAVLKEIIRRLEVLKND